MRLERTGETAGVLGARLARGRSEECTAVTSWRLIFEDTLDGAQVDPNG
jgi:hypothetical protein